MYFYVCTFLYTYTYIYLNTPIICFLLRLKSKAVRLSWAGETYIPQSWDSGDQQTSGFEII